MIVDRNFGQLCILESASILQALRVIELGRSRICFVINSENFFITTISDGDIRRALLRGISLDDSLGKIIEVRKRVLVAHENHLDDAKLILSLTTPVLPIIDKIGQLTGLVRIDFSAQLSGILGMRVCVIGMGYVGLTLALTLAERGFMVIGLDQNTDLVQKINDHSPPFYEDGLEDLLVKHVGSSVHVTCDPNECSGEVYIITVGTPLIKGTTVPDINHLTSAVDVISKRLKKDDLIILRSTVPIGCSRATVIPLLEKNSGMKVGLDFKLAFCPERTAEGKALKELKQLPQIVGGYDTAATRSCVTFFNELTHTVVDVGSLEAAEMCKLIDNTYRDTIFAYSNQMALLADSLGLCLTDLLDKVNLGYSRNQIPSPSPGVGGPCLSKDSYILEQSLLANGLDNGMISSVRRINESMSKCILDRATLILENVGKNLLEQKIFIIGFAFKGDPVTSDLRDSTTLWFLDELLLRGATRVCGFDPVIDPKELEDLGISWSDIDEGFEEAAAVFVMNNHKSYAKINFLSCCEKMASPGVFFDGWNEFSYIRGCSGISYFGTGNGSDVGPREVTH